MGKSKKNAPKKAANKPGNKAGKKTTGGNNGDEKGPASAKANGADVVSRGTEARGPSEPFDRFIDPFDRLGELFGLPGWFDRRLADRFFGEYGGLPEPIKVEEYLSDDALVVRAEIPGVDPESDIDVTVDRGKLSIAARRSSKTEDSSVSGYRTEFRYGSFNRTLRLPEGCDSDAVTASYEDGILQVTVPLVVESDPEVTKIEVSRA